MPQIRIHQCPRDTIGLSPEWDRKIDVAFAIFVVHEVPDAKNLFREIATLLMPGGLLFYAEPPFVVPGREFREYLAYAEDAGMRVTETRLFFVNRAAVLRKD
jgi:SAM-dependent methyltransferase